METSNKHVVTYSIRMDTFTRKKRSEVMSKIRSRDTSPEMAIRRSLWRRGFRYRLQYGKERIDIAFPGQKVAIFIDGCFWHLCPTHGLIPKANQTYWIPKLEGNINRAILKDERLSRDGWRVIHIWEHETSDPDAVSDGIERILSTREC